MRQFLWLLQLWRTLFYSLHVLDFLWNLFVVSLLNQHWRLVVYSDLLKPACNFLWSRGNQANNQLRVHLRDLMLFSNVAKISYVMFCWQVEKVAAVNHNAASLLLEEIILYVLLWLHYLWTIKQTVCWLYENLDQLADLNTGFMPALMLLIDFFLQLIVLLNLDFNCCSSFVLS